MSSSSCHVTGGTSAGGLVGYNSGGHLTACYATGEVEGYADVGGLVGTNDTRMDRDEDGVGVTTVATLTACYATGAVTLQMSAVPPFFFKYVGGLVGHNAEGHLIACYATGNVKESGDAKESVENVRAGGLVGANNGIIKASFAMGDVTVYSEEEEGLGAGGLAVSSSSSKVVNSYYTGTVTGGINTDGKQTTAALQSSTMADDLYASWDITLPWGDPPVDVAVWDFGLSSDYPVLSVDFDGDDTASWQEFGEQMRDDPPSQLVSISPEDTEGTEDSGVLGVVGGLAAEISPNPIGVALSVKIPSAGTLRVYGIAGELKGTHLLAAGINEVSFAEYGQGTYILHIVSHGQSAVYRVIKG